MLDDGLLVENAVFQLHAFLNVAVLHDDAVFHMRPLVDLDSAEQHAVLHHAVDDAAVRHHGIEHPRIVHVPGGQLVAHLGVYRLILREQTVAHIGVQRGQVELEVALHAVQTEAYILIFVAAQV